MTKFKTKYTLKKTQLRIIVKAHKIPYAYIDLHTQNMTLIYVIINHKMQINNREIRNVSHTL